MPQNYWQAIGYIHINNFAFRIDMFENLFLARQKLKKGPFRIIDLMNPIGVIATIKIYYGFLWI